MSQVEVKENVRNGRGEDNAREKEVWETRYLFFYKNILRSVIITFKLIPSS